MVTWLELQCCWVDTFDMVMEAVFNINLYCICRVGQGVGPQGSCQDQSLGSWWPLCSGEGDSSYNSQFFPLHYGVWPVIYSLILGYWCHCQVWSWPTRFCTFKTLETTLDTQYSGYISLGCLSFQLLAVSLGWQSTYWSPQRRENISQSYDWLGKFSIYY